MQDGQKRPMGIQNWGDQLEPDHVRNERKNQNYERNKLKSKIFKKKSKQPTLNAWTRKLTRKHERVS